MKQALEHRFEFLLQDWVEHNTHVKNYVGVKSFMVKLEEELDGLGCQTEWHLSQAGTNSLVTPSALVGVLPSTGERSTGPMITLVAHADTIFKKDSEFSGITWSADRKFAIGPGVLENKGGVLIALFVLEQLALMETRNFSVQYLCIPNAEDGSVGFAKVFEKLSFRSQCLIGLSPASEQGMVFSSNSGKRIYQVNLEKDLNLFIQRLAHLLDAAGNAKDVGLSISKMNTDGELSAVLSAEFKSQEEREHLHALISSQFKNDELKILSDCPPLLASAASEVKNAEFHKKAIKVLQENESRFKGMTSGKASVANFFYRPNLMIIDGLGPVGEAHGTSGESIEVNSLFTRSKIILELIEWVGSK